MFGLVQFIDGGFNELILMASSQRSLRVDIQRDEAEFTTRQVENEGE